MTAATPPDAQTRPEPGRAHPAETGRTGWQAWPGAGR